MIQKNIHSIWFQGWDQLPSKFLVNVNSIQTNNPDWKYFKWDEAGIHNLIAAALPQYLEKYNSFKYMHQKIDFGRYAILYYYGGVSVDTDVLSLKSFNATPYLSDSDFIVSANSTGSFINNATILVSAKNPLMKSWLDSIDGECKFYQGDQLCIYNTTGPGAFTKFINNSAGKLANSIGEITVLSNRYFEPCSGSDSSCEVGPDAILDHQHEQSWVNPVYKKVSTAYYDLKPYHNVLIVLVVVVVGVFLIRRLS